MPSRIMRPKKRGVWRGKLVEIVEVSDFQLQAQLITILKYPSLDPKVAELGAVYPCPSGDVTPYPLYGP